MVAWAALIFVASAQSDLVFVPDATLDLVVRKLGHAAVFGILALLLWRALATTTRLRRPWAWALALAILYAISDELHQGGVSGRYPSPVDVAIDAAGALIAVAIVGERAQAASQAAQVGARRPADPGIEVAGGVRQPPMRRSMWMNVVNGVRVAWSRVTRMSSRGLRAWTTRPRPM